MSFRRRLTLLAAGAVAVAIVLASAVTYVLVRSELRGQIDDSLVERAMGAKGLADRPPRSGLGPQGSTSGAGPQGTEPELGPFPEAGLGGPATAGQIVNEEGDVLASRGLGEAELPVEPAVTLLAQGDRGPVFSDAEVDDVSLRVISMPVGSGTAIQIARSLEEVDSTLSRLALIMGLITVGGIGAAAALGPVVAGAALAPVKRLTTTSEEVARTEDLSRRIEIEGDDELARLGASFNAMLAALETSVGAQKQLVADASHELRTPLTSLRTNIETLARRPEMPRADREQLLADLESELLELGRLVDDIVDLAREGAESGEAMELLDVRLDEVVAACVERTRRRATEDVTITARLEECLVRGTPERLDRAVGNLLDNALKWTPEGGTISVELEGCELTVSDTGPGIAEQDLPHIFDRFYRAAAARGTPGSGLGLAIVDQVARSHGGSVVAGRGESGGAQLVLSLPAAPGLPD